MSLTGTLARWSTNGTAARLAEAARTRAGTAIFDWFGAYYAGLLAPEAALYRKTLALVAPEPGPVGNAWLIAAISHIEEVDDGHRLAMLHPGVVTIPPILALGAANGANFAQLRTALVVGYEAAVRVGAALGPSHYKTHHSSATAGTFGAAAAAGVMLCLDEEKMGWALGHAGTQAAGLWQFLDDGAEIAKPAHIGHAVRNGLFAAALAHAGVPGALHILEGRRGFANAFRVNIDADELVPAARANQLAMTTATIKAWPVCGQMHHVLDAVKALRADHLVPADEIASIEITSFAATSEIAGVTEPKTIAQARFSTAFCVALLWIKGTMALTDAALADPEIAHLAAKVKLVANSEFTAGFPQRRAGRVVIVTRAGGRVDHLQEGRRGDPEFPLTEDEMAERFDAFAAGQPNSQKEAVRNFARLVSDADPQAEVTAQHLSQLLTPS